MRALRGIDLPPVGIASDCRDARNTLTAIYDNGTETGRYDYGRNLIRIRRKTASENVEYVLDDKRVLNEVDASVSGKPALRRYHYGTKILAVTESAGMSYIPNDGIGPASDFWSSGGLLAKGRQYDAWGGFRNGNAPGSGEAKVAYTGRPFDPETGWEYFGGSPFGARTLRLHVRSARKPNLEPGAACPGAWGLEPEGPATLFGSGSAGVGTTMLGPGDS